MAHLKTLAYGLGVMAVIAAVCGLVGTVVSIVDPEYIMGGLIAIWLVVMCYLLGSLYEAYKEMKNVKPY